MGWDSGGRYILQTRFATVTVPDDGLFPRFYNVKESRSKCVGKDGLINTTVGSIRRPFASGKGEKTMGDFYVTLPSDPSPEFPDNSPSSFKVRLPQRLTLPGKGWRVALSSMSVPDTRVNLYHLVPKYNFLFYTTLMRSGARSDVQVNMMNIDQFNESLY